MNRAPDDRKMGLMAVVVTHMAEQRMTMDGRKAKMEDATMRHMMEPMQMGKESMAERRQNSARTEMNSERRATKENLE